MESFEMWCGPDPSYKVSKSNGRSCDLLFKSLFAKIVKSKIFHLQVDFVLLFLI